ncbi:hypothetical protein H0274_04940 [Altererythrobacter sp. CC-YST694]|uniref:hypothetical protein n=1 Tax=Altererythrobacter sp. CC-YST694 TaxID=2755038 RepID=UPI001D00A0D3|nr:hypothetical protein [Altererythrobacter sp. CC-YST694]MCB5424595.1 hypothetical protein [Altererythrobacter sp. CC-YST694]
MRAFVAFRAVLPLAIAATGLAGCNLVKKQDEQVEAPAGTKIVQPDVQRDLPKDTAGQPVDKGEGPVLQALGDLSGVDLGQRKGGCTFQHNDGRDLLIAAAPADQGAAGKAAVRVDGVIVNLATMGDIGLDGIKAGGKYSNGTITVEVARGSKGGVSGGVSRYAANLGVTDANGKQRLYSPGMWICA